MTTSTKRRQAGEGGISEYRTQQGRRYLVKFTAMNADGSKRVVLKRGFRTKQEAAAYLRDVLPKAEQAGGLVQPSKVTLGEYLAKWLDGVRVGESTLASYRKMIRLYVQPTLGSTPLSRLTAGDLDALYRRLEREGRANGAGGLSARTVRYLHTTITAALDKAVDERLIERNPARQASPPTAKEAEAPEMRPWSESDVARFLAWVSAPAADGRARHRAELAAAWRVLFFTGLRRGELLALRWRDVELDATKPSLRVRRSVGVVKTKGEGERVVEGPTKTARSRRTISLDATTVAVLRRYRAERASANLALARPDALVFGDHEGQHRHPERFSRRWVDTVAAARRDLAAADPLADELPVIRLHDTRHTHATLLLKARVPLHVVSRRLGHASEEITLRVYAHALPGDDEDAADSLDALVAGIG